MPLTQTEKRLLLVSGGPRKDGCSAVMLREFTALLAETAAPQRLSFARYDAYEERFAPCTDCRYCRTAEGCANPDMDRFWRDFETVDGIVIASPVYHLSYPAPMKAILDRTQRYFHARFSLGKRPPIDKYRPAVLLLSAGSSDEDGSVAVRQFERIFTVTHCTLVAHCLWNGTDALPDNAVMSDVLREELRRSAGRLSREW